MAVNMERRSILTMLGLAPLASLLSGPSRADAPTPDFEPLVKSDAEWRELLPANRYQILFEEGTERAFTSPLNDEKRPGTYLCAACALPLFDAAHKYDSGTGWPSFTQPISGRLRTKTDFKLIWPRTEYHCARCGGHQGHVFEDGPPPHGQRWCNNGLALTFAPAGAPLPPLRV
jgi:peptide-methionine (R)-S-oxide reductase